MIDALSIPVLLGTVRQGRRSESVARYLVTLLEARGVKTQLIDPRTLHLPMDDEGEDLKPRNPKYVEVITRADGLLLVVPEYNRGYPGSLKRMLDICYDEYAGKAVGICGVSSGVYGGARMIVGLLPVLKILGLTMIKPDLHVGPVDTIFSGDGTLLDAAFDGRAGKFLDELARTSLLLKAGRQALTQETAPYVS